MGVRLADPKARTLRLPFAINVAAAVLVIGLGGIYVSHRDWDGVLLAVCALTALLQTLGLQKDQR